MKYDPRLATFFAHNTVPGLQSSSQAKKSFSPQDFATSKLWSADGLSRLMSTRLKGDQIIVVSNRQPFTHEFAGGQVKLVQPASGLVTALEPIVRACDGTWIAHGSGPCDHEFVDAHDRCPAPIGVGSYKLRRLWLSEQEQQGYCDGFANSGLWPLCHMVHVKPVFRETDWQHYATVNARFARAVVQEARGPNPIVLIQDYHLALVPQLLRAQLPHATIVSFWHIPWTHPEQMAVCPWLPALVAGLLGSDIVGFQTPQHVRNFMELAQRSSNEICRTDSAVSSPSGHSTQVRDYPISIAWPSEKQTAALQSVSSCRSNAQARWSLTPNGKLVVAVDRFDYTKGIIERLNAFEQLLLTHPQWQGTVRFVQIASPTRVNIKQYSDYQKQVFDEVARINHRFCALAGAPIVLLDAQHDRATLNELYRSADVCLVSSLHDGMNLVSKEFVAARDDEKGVLVLSQFAGAANELGSALIVNPYHTVQVAAALHQALTMPAEEQTTRMRAMRGKVRHANVYRWAANMLSDASALRTPPLHVPARQVLAKEGAPVQISMTSA